jgi:anaerobic selenocysteine-containing dehydrogenase
MEPEPILEISPEDAARFKVKNGGWVYVETRRGKVKMKARYNPGILRGVVFAQKAWWFPEKDVSENLHGFSESNINMCTEDDPEKCDQLCGGWIYRALLCKVTPA